ncbi:HNH endonuclease [Marinomonas pollencensis]|uniref:HNH endonuclease n=1 Tax=Marinomonas pollencensis TaxID=491954 RepID=A0A3E0DHF2_9GAMM|nr:HNH endonuclease [Marinomonas pollencensis]REG82154.1 HNH endonuclease [Marinomonas pollencensis]
MNKVIEALVNTGQWGENDVILGIRAGFKCEYCDKDLLATVDNYKEWQKDHIIPLSKGGENINENIAISCKTCNVNIKGRWNPADESTSENPTRQELITIVREYGIRRRTQMLSDVCLFRKIVFTK